MPYNYEYEKWVRQVRAPATRGTEGRRCITYGRVKAIYEIAQIPRGWTWCAETECHLGGAASPWSDPEPRRRDALAHALAFLRAQMESYIRGKHLSNARDAREVLNVIDGGDLFGFVEPPPETANTN